MVVDAGLAAGTAELEPVGVPGDSDWVSVPGVAVLGVWGSEPGEPVLGVWDSEPVWALAGKASIAPRAATLSKRQCLRKADWCI
jgi:hypothetical protein